MVIALKVILYVVRSLFIAVLVNTLLQVFGEVIIEKKLSRKSTGPVVTVVFILALLFLWQ